MTPEPPKIIQLDEIESIPGPGSLTWRPVRLALGVRAFGCNAYTAGRSLKARLVAILGAPCSIEPDGSTPQS
jgi:hypothetical protein